MSHTLRCHNRFNIMSLSRLVFVAIILTLFCYFVMQLNLLKPRSEVEAASELGFGLSQTINHGTISIGRSDGTFEDMGRVNEDELYIKLMRRLSSNGAQHWVAHDLGNHHRAISATFELGRADDTIRIRELISQLLRERHPSGLPLEVLTVIIAGSPRSIDNSGTLQGIQYMVLGFGRKVDMLTVNPENIAARGAAELAWRALGRPRKEELRQRAHSVATITRTIILVAHEP